MARLGVVLVFHNADAINMHNSKREKNEDGLRNESGRDIFRFAGPSTAVGSLAAGRGRGGGKTGEIPVTKQAFNVPAGKIVLNM